MQVVAALVGLTRTRDSISQATKLALTSAQRVVPPKVIARKVVLEILDRLEKVRAP